MGPKVSIGMFTHNEEKYVAEALESLLGQTYGQFCLIVLDDCSTDDTEKIILKYASIDKRIKFFRNEKRMGYAANYRKTFRLAGNDVDYFAWVAGHDRHHPRWLDTMVRVLNQDPGVVMAYHLTTRISETGERLPVRSPTFDTVGLEPKDRIRTTCHNGIGFGNMIYGLFRAEPVRKAGIYRDVLLPDMLLLTELSLHGSIKQVNEELWFRRFDRPFSLERQKQVAFGNPPWYLRFSWPLVHSLSLAWNTVLSPQAGSFAKRLLGMHLTLTYFWKYYPAFLKHRLARRNWLYQLHQHLRQVSGRKPTSGILQ